MISRNKYFTVFNVSLIISIVLVLAFAVLIFTTGRSLDMDTSTWRPKAAPLMTRWASAVDPARPHPEYPRPQLVRAQWQSLNGVWDLEMEGHEKQKILVPFCVESALSGVMQRVEPDTEMVYTRTFTVDPAWSGRRVRLVLEAAEHEAVVLVNGREVGSHRGGYDSFSFDITEALQLGGGEETVTVRVRDPTETEAIPVGKQWQGGEREDKLSFIFYTPTSGIWQSVWLEAVPEEHVTRLQL